MEKNIFGKILMNYYTLHFIVEKSVNNMKDQLVDQNNFFEGALNLKLIFFIWLFHIKNLCNWIEKNFGMLLELLNEVCSTGALFSDFVWFREDKRSYWLHLKETKDMS